MSEFGFTNIIPQKQESLRGTLTNSKQVEKRVAIKAKIKKIEAKTWEIVEREIKGRSIGIEIENPELDLFINILNEAIPSIEYEIAKEDVIEGISYKCESGKIREPNSLIPCTRESQVYKKYKDIYVDRFPLGSSDMASGGVHFHIHFPNTITEGINTGNINMRNIFSIPRQDLTAPMMAYPFWCKIVPQKDNWNFYSRSGKNTSITESIKSREIARVGRGSGIALRFQDRGYSTGHDINSIEVRMNNVINADLLGYYKVMLLLSYIMAKNLKLKNKSINRMIEKCKKMQKRCANIDFNRSDWRDGNEDLERMAYGENYDGTNGITKGEDYDNRRTSTNGPYATLDQLVGNDRTKEEVNEMIYDISNVEKTIFGTYHFVDYISFVEEKFKEKKIVKEEETVKKEAVGQTLQQAVLV